MINRLTVAELQEKLEAGEEMKLIDVRGLGEKQEGDIEGSQLITFGDPDFYDKIDGLDKTANYIIYCRSGNRSMRACMIMADEGFDRLSNLEGGIIAWNQRD